MQCGSRRAWGVQGKLGEMHKSRRVGGGVQDEGRVESRVAGCSALDGVLLCCTHLSPCAGPTLGEPLPGSPRRAQPPGAAASSWVRETVSQDPASVPQPWWVRGQRSPTPSPGLACRSAGSDRQPLLQSRRHGREKSLIPGAEQRAGTQAAHPHPSPQKSPPLPPLPWTDDLTPLKCKDPHLPWLLGFPQEVLYRWMLRDPSPTPSRVRDLGCFRSNRLEVTAGDQTSDRFPGMKEAAGCWWGRRCSWR